MEGIEVNPPYKEKAPRMELLWRILYVIPYYIIVIILGTIAWLCVCIQTLIILILGRRIDILTKVVVAYIAWTVNFHAYLLTATDEKPDIMPKF